MADDDKSADDKPSQTDLSQIEDRLKYLETIARETVARLYLIETRLGLAHKDPWVGKETPRPPQPPAGAAPPQPPPEPKPAVPPEETRGLQLQPPTMRPPQPQPPPPPPAAPGRPTQTQPPPPAQPAWTRTETKRTPPKPRPDLETRIGGSWFNRIGVVAIILGVGFFFKYAYDNRWINRWGWVSIGLALGIAFLVGGEKLRRKYASYAYGLTGCGISILYLSVYSAFNWGLVAQPVAFIAMAAVTTTASLLAARYNALAIALLGLIGGFLTPVLLSTHVDNEMGLFGYITLLDAGVLALAYRKQWRSLNYLAFGGTVLTFIGWSLEFYAREKLATTVVFLTIFFVIFALLAVLYNVINHRPTTWLDLGLVFANALLYFGTTYDLLEHDYHFALGAFAIVVAAFYMALGYFTYQRDRQDTLLVHTFLGLAFLFSVLAVPIQFDKQWVTIAWAVEGAVMTWVGLRSGDRVSRYASLVLFGIAAAHWLRVDVHDFAHNAGQRFIPLLNQRALSCAALVVALAAATRLYRRYRDTVDANESAMFTSLYVLGANAAAILLLSLDANDFFERALETGRWGNSAYEVWNNARQFTLSSLWITYGVVTLIVGITRNQKIVRAIGGVVLGVTTLKVLAVDLAYNRAEWHRTLLNETFAVLAMLVLGLAFSAWVYSKSSVSQGEKRIVLPVLILAANILALTALTTEPIGYFGRAISRAESSSAAELNNWMHFVLTVIWTVYSAVALAIGFRRNSRSVRQGALLLLAATTAKVLMLDAAYYNAQWHRLLLNQTFGAFALLIIAMSLGSWLYSRTRAVDENEKKVIGPFLAGVANVLAVTALSLEAIGYYKQLIHSARAALAPQVEISGLQNSMHFVLTAIWSIYAAAALVIATQRGSKRLRQGALFLLALAAVKVLIADAGFYDAEWHRLLINETFGAFALVIGGMSLGVYYLSRTSSVDSLERRFVVPSLVAIGNVYAIIALSLEAFGHYAMKLKEPGLDASHAADLRLAQQLSLSVIWTVYGGGMLMAGIWRRSRMLRVMALSLLSLTILKVFLVDLSSLEKIYRIISFIVLGAILLAVSYLYQRYRQRPSDMPEADESLLSPDRQQQHGLK